MNFFLLEETGESAMIVLLEEINCFGKERHVKGSANLAFNK